MRDPARSIRRGRQIFQRKFTEAQGQGPRVSRNSSGNIQDNPGFGAGLTDSCAACHGRPRGSAGSGGHVTTRPDSRDAPHLFGAGLVFDPALDTVKRPPVCGATEDGDGDGVANEVHPALLDHLEFYLLNYFKPGHGSIDLAVFFRTPGGPQ